MRTTWATRQEDETRNLNVKLGQIKDRLNRLTDAYLDQALDKAMFEARKTSLLLEQKTVEENLRNMEREKAKSPDEIDKFLELAGDAWLSHKKGLPEERREMVNIFTSNRLVDARKLDLTASIPFREIINRPDFTCCAQQQGIPRTWDKILDELATLNTQGLLPDLSLIAGLRHHDNINQTPN
jgi:hypothetical protein